MTTRDPVSSSSSSETPPSSPLALAPVIDKLIAQFAADIEWEGMDEHVRGCCPLCLNYPPEGHEPWCRIAQFKAELAALRVLGGAPETNDWERRYQDESRIVDTVWAALNISTYEQAGGRDIATIVADWKRRAEEAEATLGRVLGGAQTGDTEQEHEDSPTRGDTPEG